MNSAMRRHSIILTLFILLNLFSYIGSASEGRKVISGAGSGELLLNFTIRSIAPVFLGSYIYDLVGIHIPPISSTFNVSFSPITKKLYGYAYDAEGIYMPSMPNNFTVSAAGVKNLNIGLKKQQGSYENSSDIWKDKYSRIWISSQAEANNQGIATLESYLISPGVYQVKIFGDAAQNVSQVNIIMSLTKKIIVNGKFNIGINTTGFPSGNYSITAKALNGSLRLDQIELEDISALG